MTTFAVIPLMFATIASDVPPDNLGAFGSAKWIAVEKERGCNPAFAREFVVPQAPISATLRICGLGYQIATLNGRRVGEVELDPVPSDYRRRVYYSSFDVSNLIRPGTNRLEVLLGHGWYDFVERDEWQFDKASWRDRPKLIARLMLEFCDGSTEDVVTDCRWRRIGSPVRYDAVRSGIEEDGPVEEIDDPVAVVQGPPGRLMESGCPPTKVIRRLKPIHKKPLGGGSWLLDFGEEIAGRVRIRMRGLLRGDLVKVRYDERIGVDFTPATNRVIDAYFKDHSREIQTDYHHASGFDIEEFSPRFTYKGFRYVLVTGARTPIQDDDVVAEELRTSFRVTGNFECSDAEFNALMNMADRSYCANFVNGVPTDCPQREKNGWTGDANAACEFALYRYDNVSACLKWLRDVVDAQGVDGQIPGIVPTSGWGYFRFGTIWDGAIVEIPYKIYRYRGGLSILKEFYPAMKLSVDGRLRTQVRHGGTLDEGPGDWCSPGRATTNALVATAWFYGTVKTLAKVAAILKRPEDASRYEHASELLRESYNRAFYEGGGVYSGRTQTAQALSIHFGLVPEYDLDAARNVLLDTIHSANDHFDCGLIGFCTIFRVLGESGHADLAYKMLMQRTRPSFLAQRKIGATSLWEDFDDGFSRCHVMFADFAAWAYAYLAGIRNVEDGFCRCMIAPNAISSLDYVNAKMETPHGIISSSWRRENGGVRYMFSVPDGTCATILLPGTSELQVQSGSHEYFVAMERELGE